MEKRATTPGSSMLRTFAIVFLSMAALFAADTFLARLEEADSRAEAGRLFAEGRRLAAEGRNNEAIDRFRSALTLSRDHADYQLALAQALSAAGRYGEAEQVVEQILQRGSTSGPANLTM